MKVISHLVSGIHVSPKANDPVDSLQDYVDGPIAVVVATHTLQIISWVVRGPGGVWKEDDYPCGY